MTNVRDLQNIGAAKLPSAHALQIIGAARAAPFPTPMPSVITSTILQRLVLRSSFEASIISINAERKQGVITCHGTQKINSLEFRPFCRNLASCSASIADSATTTAVRYHKQVTLTRVAVQCG